MTMIDDVREFHEKFGVPVLGVPTGPADAIADLIYVLIGTAHEFGIP